MIELKFVWPPAFVSPQPILPVDQQCRHESPVGHVRKRTYPCNRRKGHRGRHAYVWTHTHGVVRAVWR